MSELNQVLEEMERLSKPVKALCGIVEGLEKIENQVDKVLAIK